MKTGLKWGAILGVAICVWTILLHVLGWYTVNLKAGERADIAVIILPILATVLAILERRRLQPGQTLTIAQGMATGMLTGLVSVPITACFLWYYHHYINPEWVQHLVVYHTAKMTTAGATPAAITAEVEALRRTGRDAAQFSGALIGTTLLSAMLSFVAAMVLRRSRPVA